MASSSDGLQNGAARNKKALDCLCSAFGYDGNFALTLVELDLISLGGAIRDKPHWNRKIQDAEIAKKWQSEAEGQGADPAAIKYIMAEQQHLAGLYPDNMYPAAVPGVFAADDYIPQELRSALMEGVKKLEGGGEPDWHPGSNEQVRDLVHPSLFPVVYGVTTEVAADAPPLTLDSCLEAIGTGTPIAAPPKHIKDIYTDFNNKSTKFCWLPAEFDVSEEGKVTIRSYINNLHPKTHSAMYPVIASIFQHFLPLFNEVLTFYYAAPHKRLIDPGWSWYDHIEEKEPEEEDFPDNEAYEAARKTWEEEVHIPKRPDVPEFQAPAPRDLLLDLKGRRLQVIVKLSSIHLTPEKPEYPGGNWHLEGMVNENIVATGIYYYNQENIEPSTIAYRAAVTDDFPYEQSDASGVEKMYGLKENYMGLSENEPDGGANQNLGSVTTLAERCICFPNHLQHRVEPFKLQDATKPGHRKILVFWLVNPATKIHSSERVPPQQLEWLKQQVLANSGKPWPLANIPEMPLEMIEQHLDDSSVYSFKKAEEYRLKLMEERQYAVKEQNKERFERPVMLCEH